MGEVFQTSRLPGAHHVLPDNCMCDSHPERKAVANIQGETDSFGCETHFCCQECVDEIKQSMREARERPSHCDWCKNEAVGCAPTRDYDEGMCGPVYNVCPACRKKADDEAREELEASGYFDDYDDDYEI